MKLIRNLILLIIVLNSCTPQLQLVTVKPTNNIIDSDSFTFQDSLVRIAYDFYSPNGILKFRIKNCYSQPIFIDWKNSLFIAGSDKRHSYWSDETSFNGTSQITNIEWLSGISTSSGTIQGKFIKPERITFLPPSTEIEVSKYSISNGEKFPLTGENSIIEEPNNWKKTKKTAKIKICKFNAENSPSSFRSYLTISLTEDFKQPKYCDFGFWISDIQEMNAKQMVGNYLFKTNMHSIEKGSQYHPYKKVNRFFILDKKLLLETQSYAK